MTISTRTLVQIAGWGGLCVASTGFYLQFKLIDRVRSLNYYREALKTLRGHSGAVHYLGEPIKDKRFKITDSANNCFDDMKARFRIPVSGPKDSGAYYIWAEKTDEQKWSVVRAELELKSKPNERLLIVKGKELMFIGTSKEKFFYHNTLLCLVNSLKEKNITVDLRNDSYVCGKLVNVDGFMNLTFSKAIYCDTCGNEYAFDDLFVHGRNIRYVHIPETESIINNIKNEVERGKVKKIIPIPAKKSLKMKKALLRHMATVAALKN